MRCLFVVLVLLTICATCYAQSLDLLVPDEAGAIVMVTKDASLKVRAVASWQLFTVKTSSCYADIWALEPIGAGVSLRLGQRSAMGAGYDGSIDSPCVYLRTTIAAW